MIDRNMCNELLKRIPAKGRVFPKDLSKDVCAGIVYAFSTLEEDEQQVLMLLCGDKLEYSVIAERLNIPERTVLQLEQEAIRKLRLQGRWDYICYGVRGNLRMRLAQERARAYREGFLDGYQRSGARQAVPVPDMLLEELELPTHARQCLTWAGIQTVRELAECPEERIRFMRNVGPKTASQIAEALRKVGVVCTPWDKFYLQLE